MDIDKECIGRSFAFIIGPISESERAGGPSNNVNDIINPSMNGNISSIRVDDTISLFHAMTLFKEAPNDTLAVINLGGSIGVNGHATGILLYRFNDKVFVWYFNPWGFSMDSTQYISRNHIMDDVEDFFGDDFVCIKPENSMSLVGVQVQSEECSRKANDIENRIASLEKGACVSWLAKYVLFVRSWIGSNEFLSEREPFLKLRKLDEKFKIENRNHLSSLSSYAYNKWSNSDFIPINFCMSIMKNLPSVLTKLYMDIVVISYDLMIYRDRDENSLITFLKDISLFNQEISDNYYYTERTKMEKLVEILDRDHTRVSELILVLIACKFRISFFNIKGDSYDDPMIID